MTYHCIVLHDLPLYCIAGPTSVHGSIPTCYDVCSDKYHKLLTCFLCSREYHIYVLVYEIWPILTRMLFIFMYRLISFALTITTKTNIFMDLFIVYDCYW